MIGEEQPALNWAKFAESQGMIWQSCPAGAQFRNSVCEATVKKAKRTLQPIYSDARLSTLEVETALKLVATILKSLPLTRNQRHKRPHLCTPSLRSH